MPAPKSRPVPAAPPAPKAPLAAAPSPAAIPDVAPTVQPQPEPVKAASKVSVRTKHGYPIWVPHAGRHVFPGETVELDDHEWLRRQIVLGTFVSL